MESPDPGPKTTSSSPIRYNREQKIYLCEQYDLCKYPTAESYAKFSETLGVSEHQIRIWFKNQRRSLETKKRRGRRKLTEEEPSRSIDPFELSDEYNPNQSLQPAWDQSMPSTSVTAAHGADDRNQLSTINFHSPSRENRNSSTPDYESNSERHSSPIDDNEFGISTDNLTDTTTTELPPETDIYSRIKWL